MRIRHHSFLITALVVLVTLASPGFTQDLPLAPGEVVRVDVYGREDLSGERMIDAAGMLLVPLLGRVEAAGAPPEVLEARISAALTQADLIKDAQVLIEVIGRRDVFVEGDVMVPGAYDWKPGLMVGQVVTLAGGMRRVAADDLGATLQVYGAVERLAALKLSVAGLQVQQARLQAEAAFATLVFDPAVPVDTASLHLAGLLPPDAAGLPVAEQKAALAALDVVQFRKLQEARALGDMIVFPPDIVADPGTAALRQAQVDVVEAHAGLWLANFNSLQLQRRALEEKARTLKERRAVIDALVLTMQDRLDTLLVLRDDGLVRASDVVDVQTAFSTLVATQLELLGDIADTQIAMEQQELAIKSYAATLRRDTGQELATVVAALTEAAARLPQVRRAAEIAQGYQAADADPGGVRYQIRRGTADWQDVQATHAVLPGDMVAVRAGVDF
jgi:protein involved in polysaccharide export with SLBB domain